MATAIAAPPLQRDASKLSLEALIHLYELSNTADGKSRKTIRGYTELLSSFVSYLKAGEVDTVITAFTSDMVRDYKLYLLERHKYAGHPFTPEQQKTLSPKTVQCHVRALKAFSSWLYREGYTSDNRLMNVKLPKAPRTLIEPLTPDEVKKVLASIDRSTSSGARNFAIAVLMLDAGIREGEVASLTMGQLNLKKYCLRVMGKGKKERLVPIGDYARTVLWNYIDRERGKPQSTDIDNVFLTSRGKVTTENAIKLFFSRLARSSGIPRLHAHLCRHTFGINYLMNGGDIFSLKEILGHTTLEMVSQYLHFTSAQIAVQHHKYSPMDRLKMPSPGNSIQSLTE